MASPSRLAILFWKPSCLMLESGMLPGSAQTVERCELLRLVGGFGGGSDGDLLARGEILELLAQIALDGLFGGVGRQRAEGNRGEAKRRHQDAESHGGHWLLWLAVGGRGGLAASPHSTPQIKGHSTPLIKEMTPDATRAPGAFSLEKPSAYSKMRKTFSSPPWESCPGWQPWSWPWRRWHRTCRSGQDQR